MIKPWVFEFIAIPHGDLDGKPARDAHTETYHWYLDLWAGLENEGFEGLFFSEHHFVENRLSPSPNLMIAALAPRTRRLRLGVMGNVAPMYPPWRLIEEYGMLDHLTSGRLEIGISSGNGPNEFAQIGIAPEELRPRLDEFLDILDRAMRGTPFDHDGDFWSYDNLTLAPPPRQQPRPPHWLTGLSPHAAAAAARRGYKFCTGFLSCQRAADVFNAHHAAAAETGRTTTADDLGIRRMVLLSDDAADAQARVTAAIDGLRQSMGGKPAPSAEQQTSAAAVPDAPKPQQQAVSDDDGIAGTPAMVADQIIAQCRQTGAGNFIAFLPHGVTRKEIARNYQLWGEVIPILRKAEITGAAA